MVHDFLVIGGGIAGISAAARLSALGRVLVVEAEDSIAHHASSRSAALYEPRYGTPPVVALSMASEADFKASGTLTPRGLMLLGRAGDEAAFEHDLHAMDFTPITVDEARAIVPIVNPEAVRLAAIAHHAWDIDTDLLLQGFARGLREAGGQILTKARVTSITRTATGWQVTAGAAVHEARVLVNAAGAWVDQIATMAGIRPIGFTPYRRSMARIPAPGGLDVARWPMIFGAGEQWYAKPDAGALIVSPAEEHLMEPHDAWADDMVLAEGLARYEEFVTEPVTRLISSWAGLRTFAPDRVLVIGPDPADPAFFWLAGQGGQGFQSCPGASRLAADLMAGRQPEIDAGLVAALSPARFA